ncbi:MAG: acyltransferase [Pseudomonadota bacterium]|nr:acyltransferase [Pseudomonadota bacterium]MDE3038090.1 acyltransferase [Pseudomonadota bacterium]
MLNDPAIHTRSDGIDFMRAVLALWVMFTHLVPWAGVTGQHVPALLRYAMEGLLRLFQPDGELHPAVLGFIVLSGYCIHRGGARKGGFNLRSFAVRRLFRILPVFVLATAAGAGVFLFCRPIDPKMLTTLTGTSDITIVGLAAKLSGLSAFIPRLHAPGFQGNAPLATVMAEIWLYVFYAAAAAAFYRGLAERRFWTGVIAVFILTLLIVRHTGGATVSWWQNGSFISFMLYWWIGAAFVGRGLPGACRRNLPYLIGGWTLLTLVIFLGAHDMIITEARKFLYALLFGLVIVRLDGRQDAVFRLAAPIGRAGYSIYAFHAPILVLCLLLGAAWDVTAAAAIAGGMMFYRCYEKPLTRRGKNRRSASSCRTPLSPPAAL